MIGSFPITAQNWRFAIGGIERLYKGLLMKLLFSFPGTIPEELIDELSGSPAKIQVRFLARICRISATAGIWSIPIGGNERGSAGFSIELPFGTRG